MVPNENQVFSGGRKAGQYVRLHHFSCLLHQHNLQKAENNLLDATSGQPLSVQRLRSVQALQCC